MTVQLNRMRDLETVLKDLQYEISTRLGLLSQLNQVASAGLSPGKEYEERQRLQMEGDKAKTRCIRELEELLHFPPKHIRHQVLLSRFWEKAGYERSVFVMTKFPRAAGDHRRQPKDKDLENVLMAVDDAILAAGFEPRTANTTYHSQLWDNVELHLVGCHLGIAIVEDRYLPELNPNVVMEWGWMRAMAKPVLFLVEQNFKKTRADLEGLLKETFSWTDPRPGISAAVTKFLAAQAADPPSNVI